MAYVANTRVGVLRRGVRNGIQVHLLECPGCKLWIELDHEHWLGRQSVDHKTRWCVGYTATHNFSAIVEAAGGFRAI